MSKPVCNIVEGLRSLMVPIGSVKPDPKNTRVHGKENIAAIQSSLTEFGQYRPAVAEKKSRIVRVGNGMLEAAKGLGWTHLAVVFVDESKLKAAILSITDNRTSDLSEFDYQRLGEVLRELKTADLDITQFGWKDYELAPLMQATWVPPTPTDGAGGGMGAGTGGQHSLAMSKDDQTVVAAAVERIRLIENDELIPESRCVAMICQQYLDANPAPENKPAPKGRTIKAKGKR